MILLNKKRLCKLIGNIQEVSNPENWDDYTVSGSVPANELFDIYNIRKDISGNRFSGYDETLAALKAEGKRRIKVHVINCEEKAYIFFTDKAVNKVLGILLET